MNNDERGEPMLAYRPVDPLALRRPQGQISAEFDAYYRRALAGDLSALTDFFLNNCYWEPDLGGAFYECIGFLACSPFPEHQAVVGKLMSLNGRSKQCPLERAPNLAEFDRLRAVFKRHASELRTWIDDVRKAAILPKKDLTPIRLWCFYEGANGAARSFVAKVRRPEHDTQAGCNFWANTSLRKENPQYENAQSTSQRAKAECESLSKLYLRYENAALGDALKLTKGLFCRAISTAPRTPRELFLLLARTSPRLSTSVALRKFAAQQAGIAEGFASRYHAQKGP